MLIELAYRMVVEETPFIQQIRDNVITFITPVLEVDGRERTVDAYYYSKKNPGASRQSLMMYWGKYVQHDNNRDGMGQYLKLTQAFTKGVLEWHPTVLHDLHEAQSYLYVSTGTGPYNATLDPIQIDEWWLLAETEVMEMAKRGVPGVFTYGFYDGWVPTISSGSPSPTTRSGASTKSSPMGRTSSRTSNSPPLPRHANGSVPTRRCPPSSGDPATTPTSRNPLS